MLPSAHLDAPGRSEIASPQSPGPGGRGIATARLIRGVLFALVAGALTLSFLTRPFAVLDNEADASLSVVLSYAHQHGLQFGTDLVYTYGPLGFLIFPYFQPHAASARLLVNLVLCLVVAAGLCRVAWRLGIVFGSFLLVLFAWAAANIEPRADLVIDAGIFCWSLLCFVEEGTVLFGVGVVLATLLAFVALAKLSFLVIAAVGLPLVAVDLLLRRRGWLAFGLASIFAVFFIAGWLASGQSLLHLKPFIINGLAVVQGYNQAQGWEGMETVRLSGIALAVLSFVLVLTYALMAFDPATGNRRWRQACLLAWMLFFAFTVWKHGFVRGDAWHVGFFLGFVPVLALGLGILRPLDGSSRPEEGLTPASVQVTRTEPPYVGSYRAAFAYNCIAIVCCLLSVQALEEDLFASWEKSVVRPMAAIWENARLLLAPRDYQDQMMPSIQTNRLRAQLPSCRQTIGQSRVDLFGQSQAFLSYNDLNYRPRPVFQSYVACTADLMRLNEQFYLSSNAPRYVLFELAAIDRKFPPLEDGWLLRDLLINYELVGAEGRYLLLEAKDPPAVTAPALTLLGHGTVHAGEQIDMSVYGAATLWLEIELKPSFVGRLRQFLYRPPLVRLAAWRSQSRGRILRRRAPASMLAAGFLASPLVLSNEDVWQLYRGWSTNRPGAYSIEMAPGEEHWWEEAIGYRVYKIEPHPG